MLLENRKGVTLVEALVSIFLLSVLVVGILGAFFISSLSASHGRHRMAALNILRSYIEEEARAKYDGGSDNEADYYVTVTSASPVSVTIDDRGTPDTTGDLVGTIQPDPYYPDNIEKPDGSPILHFNIPYKIVGFIVTWTEDVSGRVYTERMYTYVSYHSTT